MGELIKAAFIVYGVVAIPCVIALMVVQIESSRAHWTRPFAGFLWPLLAVIAIWIAWSRRND